ncbi:MAG TPA: formylglycine-generating enzyme family protein, partial [Acidobacteriota bacterium]|nr:formylglycine-generating enzyme family protein [Acidobacteriota bacterium]
VTQKQWLAVMGQNPSNFNGDNLPVEQVSWEAAVEFLRRLNASGGKFLYRLPTEAEWEYACRAGTTTRYSFGDDEKLLGEYAWYDDNSAVDDGFSEDIAESSTQPVGKKKPNAWGLHDMHGNVWEWCLDWYHDTYQGAPPDNRPWDDGTSHQYRVVRGGSWLDSARYCRSARRRNVAPQIGLSAVGFRVVAAIRM